MKDSVESRDSLTASVESESIGRAKSSTFVRGNRNRPILVCLLLFFMLQPRIVVEGKVGKEG